VVLLRTFWSKTTPQAFEYLDLHVKEWVLKENVKIVNANQSFGILEGKGGQKEPNIVLSVWYEKAEAPAPA